MNIKYQSPNSTTGVIFPFKVLSGHNCELGRCCAADKMVVFFFKCGKENKIFTCKAWKKNLTSFKFSPQSKGLCTDQLFMGFSTHRRGNNVGHDGFTATIILHTYVVSVVGPISTNGAVICDCCGPSASSSLPAKEAGRCRPSTSASFSLFAPNSGQLISNSTN